MIYMYIETFHVSVIAPNATMVIYGILFGGLFLGFLFVFVSFCFLFLMTHSTQYLRCVPAQISEMCASLDII